MTLNQRPGVYSRYDLSSSYVSPLSGAYCAVVAKANGGETGVLYQFTGRSALREVFSPDNADSALFGCAEILLESGVSRVLAVKVDGNAYEAALALIETEENIGAVVCDCESDEGRLALRESVLRSAEALRERMAFCGTDQSAAAISAASALNCERVVLCCPGVLPAAAHGGQTKKAAYGAAALAGAVLSKNDCTWNFAGTALPLIKEPTRLTDAQVQAAIAAGVTLLEQCGDVVECVRALSTRTKTAGEIEYSLRELNTILCIDDVMRAVRASLKASLRGQRLSGRSYSTIQSQVAVVLGSRVDAGVLEDFQSPKAYADASDPSICAVELSFRIAHVVSQIHVTAHIQI